MPDRLHVQPRHRQMLDALLREHLPDVEVWAYGSRVTGRSHDGSDLDLVLRGPGLKKIPANQLADFEEAFQESNIPFLVEARDWARLPERFHREIERDYVVLVERQSRFATSQWRTVKFCDAFLINPPVSLERGQRYPFVDMASVTPGTRSVAASRQRPFPGSGSRFMHGDTLMARITPCLENGKISRYQATSETREAHGSTEFIVIRGSQNISDGAFAYYATRSDVIRNHSIGQMTGTSGRQRVPVEALANLPIRLPPLPEQRAIAHILGTLDDKIELNRRMNETLEAMARALFKSWFIDFAPVRAKAALKTASPEQGASDAGASFGNDWSPQRAREYLDRMDPQIAALFPDRLVESELGEIPEGWEVSHIGKEVDVVGGATPSTKNHHYWEGGQHHWATPKDLSGLSSLVLLDTGRKITEVGASTISSGILPVGTVLLSSRAPIGYLAIAGIPTAVNQGFIAMICKARLSKHFVFFWCEQNLNRIKGIAGGSTFAEISKSAFRPIPVAVPPASIMRNYESRVHSLFDSIAANAKESILLARIRDALLPKLISGELRVADFEKSAREAS